MDPISSSFASGISATMRIFEAVYQIQATDEQTSAILNTANHVERNLKEAQRLFRTKTAFLDSHENEWVKSAIQDTRDALQSIAKLIEPARVERMTKKDIGMMTKTCWAFKYNPQARDKHAMLNVCHQTLMVVITRLHLTNLPTVSEAPDQGPLPPPPPYEHNMKKLWTWQDQRKNRKRSTTSLGYDIKGGPVFLVATDRQELEVPPLNSDSYSTTTSITDSQRGNLAQELGYYNTDYHLSYPDTLPKPAPSHNEAFELSSHLMSSTAPYSHDRWPNASHSNISLPGSGVDLPSANTRSIHSVITSHETPAAPEKNPHMFEMSAAQLSPEKQMPQLIGREIGQPRTPIDRSIPPCSLPGNAIKPLFPTSTRSSLTSQSWGCLASAEGPHPSDALSGSVKKSEIPRSADTLACRSELEAEAVGGGAGLAPDTGSGAGAGARRTERGSTDCIWASGAWTNSSPDLASIRPVADFSEGFETWEGGAWMDMTVLEHCVLEFYLYCENSDVDEEEMQIIIVTDAEGVTILSEQLDV
ncbi:MAG: hypothetical protein Q9175_004652 [Cornicularia normoerica]